MEGPHAAVKYKLTHVSGFLFENLQPRKGAHFVISTQGTHLAVSALTASRSPWRFVPATGAAATGAATSSASGGGSTSKAMDAAAATAAPLRGVERGAIAASSPAPMRGFIPHRSKPSRLEVCCVRRAVTPPAKADRGFVAQAEVVFRWTTPPTNNVIFFKKMLVRGKRDATRPSKIISPPLQHRRHNKARAAPPRYPLTPSTFAGIVHVPRVAIRPARPPLNVQRMRA